MAFSQLKPMDLLLETEKAVGDSRLWKLHQKLINDTNDIKGLKTVRALHTTRPSASFTFLYEGFGIKDAIQYLACTQPSTHAHTPTPKQ